MEKINIAELLRDCPKGMELDCTMLEKPVKYTGLTKGEPYIITIKTPCGRDFYLTKEGYLYDMADSKCIIFPKGKTTWEGFQRPFKDGDILVSKAKQPFIFQSFNSNNGCCSYCGIDAALQFRLHSDDWAYVNFLRFATEEEKEKLFQAIKDNGYKWNAETKTLEKLVNMEDIKLDIPDGYEFFGIDDDNKIVLTKIQSKYPKTYEECCKVLGIEQDLWFVYEDIDDNHINPACVSNYRMRRLDLYHNLEKLIICRDAYWKIAGEQMGMSEPWKPDWKNDEQGRHMIMVYENKLHKDESIVGTNFILVFPTKEMRDAFYKNFKELIELCKELL